MLKTHPSTRRRAVAASAHSPSRVFEGEHNVITLKVITPRLNDDMINISTLLMGGGGGGSWRWRRGEVEGGIPAGVRRRG